MADFIVDFIPKGRRNRPAISMTPEYLTLHQTGNPRKGAGALAHAKWLKSDSAANQPVSYHFTVDDKYIVQHLPTTEVGWHCGDGRYGKGNRSSIGIEICENPDSDMTVAEDNAARLVADLMVETGIFIDNIVPHKFWTGKNCPRHLLPHWGDWMMKVRGYFVGG